MSEPERLLWLPAALALALWLVALSFQLADLGTAKFDSRRLARGVRSHVRLHPVAWTIPVAAMTVIGIGIGIEYLQRLIFDSQRLDLALIVALALAVGLVAGWVIVTGATMSVPSDSYRVIRDELVELHGTRVQQDWLDGLHDRLEAIDEAVSRTPPPPGDTWRSAAVWVLRRPQRLIPVAAAIVLLVFTALGAASESGHEARVVAAVGAVLVSGALAVLGARASVTLLSAVRATQVQYRTEALQLMIESEKTSRKRVAGLGDRVTRALQILREQQG